MYAINIQAVVLHKNLKLGFPIFFRIRVPLGTPKGEGRVSFFTWYVDVDVGTRAGTRGHRARVRSEAHSTVTIMSRSCLAML